MRSFRKGIVSLTDAVYEYARQDEVEHVEHWPPPQPDVVGDVNVGLLAAGVVDHVALRAEPLQLELAVGLVVGLVARLVDDAEVQLKRGFGKHELEKLKLESGLHFVRTILNTCSNNFKQYFQKFKKSETLHIIGSRHGLGRILHFLKPFHTSHY